MLLKTRNFWDINLHLVKLYLKVELDRTHCRPGDDIEKAALDWNPQVNRKRGRPKITWKNTIVGVEVKSKPWRKTVCLCPMLLRVVGENSEGNLRSFSFNLLSSYTLQKGLDWRMSVCDIVESFRNIRKRTLKNVICAYLSSK